jgi:hypothetical protein
MAAGPYDAPGNVTLTEFRSADEFSHQAAQNAVSAKLTLAPQPLKVGDASGCYAASSGHATPTAAWSKLEKQFAPPLNLSGHQALGVWVFGDGQGEVLNLQLRSPEHLVGNLADHYIPIDFTGWRYFELIEPEGSRYSHYQWPYGNLYAIYRESLQHGQVEGLGLWYNNLPTNKSVTCYLSPVRALPVVKTTLIRPSIQLGGTTLTFPVDIESGRYLEFRSRDDCKLHGPQGELIRSVVPAGTVPQLGAGENELVFRCSSPNSVRARARVTVMTQGNPLE